MFEAVFEKSRDEGLPFREVLRRELVEIPQINAAINASHDNALTMFRGLNVMALAHFGALLENTNSDVGDKRAFMSEVERFIGILEQVEAHNMSVPLAAPRTERNIAERASRIGRWVAERFCVERV
jgi:hypothetical protein